MLLLSHYLNNSLQLPSVSDRVLNDLPAGNQDLLLIPHAFSLLQREVYPAILHHPAPAPRKLHHATLALKEKQILRVGDWEGRVSFLRARCDFRADRADEDLENIFVSNGIFSTESEFELIRPTPR